VSWITYWLYVFMLFVVAFETGRTDMRALFWIGFALLGLCIWLRHRTVEQKPLWPFHRHTYTNKLTVSGHGYTEYEVWFCQDCTKVFGKQTRGQQ
jgi:hypothetical protein